MARALLGLLLYAVVVQSVAAAPVVNVQLIASVAVTAIAARRVVADVMTTCVVFLAFVHVCIINDMTHELFKVVRYERLNS